jgi:hypothetical protein
LEQWFFIPTVVHPKKLENSTRKGNFKMKWDADIEEGETKTTKFNELEDDD